MGFGKAHKIARNKAKQDAIKAEMKKELVEAINKMDDNYSYSLSGMGNGLIYNMPHLGSAWKEFLKQGLI